MSKELWAVEGDPNSHGEGRFRTPANTTVKINNKNVIVKGDHAYGDNALHPDPIAEGSSGTVYAYNIKVHRNNDTRNCGALTVVEGQSTVFVG